MHGPPQSAAPFVVFETSVGVFVVELYTRHAQNTCYNFSELARAGYYNRTVFHRVVQHVVENVLSCRTSKIVLAEL